ncbi:MAG: hypothetical protein ACJ746_06415 [Bryobacteraceae bacterium]
MNASDLWPLVIPALIVNIVTTAATLPRTDHNPGASASATSDSSETSLLALLTRLAKEQILSDTDFLGKTRFSIDPQNRTLFYDLRPVPPSAVLSEKDPDAAPLEALIRLESVRRDLGISVPQEDFWVTPFNHALLGVRECVDQIAASQSKQDAGAIQYQCSSKIGPRFNELKASILAYAAAHDLKLAEPDMTRSPATGFKIHVNIDPPGGHVKVMTLLEYKKYKYSKTPPDRYQWNELLDAETEMIGWYHYRAEWRSNITSTDEDDFNVTAAGTLTFTPKLSSR